MSNIYLCARMSGGEIELISTEQRQCRWTHLEDLTGLLTTEQRIPFTEIPSDQLPEIIREYQGDYIPFD